jgi:hypothetical protein
MSARRRGSRLGFDLLASLAVEARSPRHSALGARENLHRIKSKGYIHRRDAEGAEKHGQKTKNYHRGHRVGTESAEKAWGVPHPPLIYSKQTDVDGAILPNNFAGCSSATPLRRNSAAAMDGQRDAKDLRRARCTVPLQNRSQPMIGADGTMLPSTFAGRPPRRTVPLRMRDSEVVSGGIRSGRRLWWPWERRGRRGRRMECCAICWANRQRGRSTRDRSRRS